jgi:hypothetical protein
VAMMKKTNLTNPTQKTSMMTMMMMMTVGQNAHNVVAQVYATNVTETVTVVQDAEVQASVSIAMV